MNAMEGGSPGRRGAPGGAECAAGEARQEGAQEVHQDAAARQ